MRGLAQGLAILLVALGTYWTLLFLLQRAVLFPTPRPRPTLARPSDAELVWLDLPSGGRVEAWFLPASAGGAGPGPVIVFTHGIGELLDDWAEGFGPPRSWGISVLLVEYPGYGRSPGSPSERSIAEAVVAAYDWVVARPGVDPRRVVGYGRSLGGGAAALLASRRPVAALVLESTFTSVRDMALAYGLPGFLVRDPFEVRAVVRRYPGPVLILHGERDEVIPFRHGRRLAEAAPRARFVAMPCAHNDCPRPWREVRRFLVEAGVLPGGGPAYGP